MITTKQQAELQDCIVGVILNEGSPLYEIAVQSKDGYQGMLAGSLAELRENQKTGKSTTAFPIPLKIPFSVESTKQESIPELLEFAKKNFLIPPTDQWNRGYGFAGITNK